MILVPVTALDYVSLIVMGFSILISVFRGFVREVLGIFAWVGAALATYIGFPLVDPLFSSWIPNKLLGDIVAGSSIFLIVLIVLSLVAHSFSDWIHKGALNAPDRLLGVGFGALRGIVLLCCVYILIAWGYHKKGAPEWFQNAAYLPYLKKSSDYLLTFIPESARKQLNFVDAESEPVVAPGGGLMPDIGVPDKPDLPKPGAQPIQPPHVVAQQQLALLQNLNKGANHQ